MLDRVIALAQHVVERTVASRTAGMASKNPAMPSVTRAAWLMVNDHLRAGELPGPEPTANTGHPHPGPPPSRGRGWVFTSWYVIPSPLVGEG